MGSGFSVQVSGNSYIRPDTRNLFESAGIDDPATQGGTQLAGLN
jgi:hypothetical protein